MDNMTGNRTEKQQQPPDSDEDQDFCQKPIFYQNLTFETELPSPSVPVDEIASIPPPPNLTKLDFPYDWSPTHKAFITGVSCISTLFSSFAASCYSPGVTHMTAEWHVSQVAVLVGITTFTSGFAVGPMFLAPFSEINGRKPVFVATAILFAVCQLCCSVTRSFPGMLVARFFAGVGGSTFSTMVGGIVSDIYLARDRNTPMALFSWAALFGTGLGPLVCGFIAEYTTWRWIFYVQIITGGMISLAVILFFRETRAPVVLRARAERLNKWYEELESKGYYGVNWAQQDVENKVPEGTIAPEKQVIRLRWKIAADEERANLSTMLRTSLLRPFQLLFTEPVVFFFALWAAFAWSVLYINLSVIPLVFESAYGFSLSKSDAIFTASCTGSTLALFISIYQEHLASTKWQKGKWNSVPEHRLYFSCLEGICLPIGLFLFGWSSHYQVHWVVPAIALGIATLGIFSIYLAVFNYLTDTYHRYASSALAAQSFCRNMLGGIFPLVSTQMFDNLSFGPAASLLGGIATALALVPWVLVFFGPQIRAKSKLAKEIMD
ncbi:hypothetical protein ASPWEDRAFT_170761 [Aspergillus wentii DTO 134E9]|uniref:Major facilitator superfamily (MFS) profile domain-containing protein n=1 Tax=Aspergillus wentii DTO 134E9 TaxID=1073089 RepID=A0A1L9RQP1_ASPWE|nr:uncharacterized protein ASPWEDRAFT_170761 [Aspergillus wentii DTO 134E9]OJJ37276.1 hypothetical protein ASPWEDRAFT_170761 [Aspergillus wentii DTO 134E9]